MDILRAIGNTSAVGLALILAWPGAVLGQQTRVVQPNPQDSLAGTYRIHEPAGKPWAC